MKKRIDQHCLLALVVLVGAMPVMALVGRARGGELGGIRTLDRDGTRRRRLDPRDPVAAQRRGNLWRRGAAGRFFELRRQTV